MRLRLRKNFYTSWLLAGSFVAAGLYLGLYHKGAAHAIAPLGDLYLDLLRMCILPYLLAVVTVSLGRLLRSRTAAGQLRRIIIIFVGGMLVASASGTAAGLVLGPGRNLPATVLAALGSTVRKATQSGELEVPLTGPIVHPEMPSLLRTVVDTVPVNIFRALSDGAVIQVLIFALIFGVALALVPQRNNLVMTRALEAVYGAFQRIIHWVNFLLPLALCAMIADHAASAGATPFAAMAMFLIGFGALAAAWLVACSLVVWWRSGAGYIASVTALKEPLLLAVATRSSINCVPATVEAMHLNLRFERKSAELVAPLAITLCRYGPLLYYAFGTVFAAQLYGVPLDLRNVALIILTSALAGIASIGTTGVLGLTMMSLPFGALGLPIEAPLALFIAIDPLFDATRTLCIVYGNCAATALVAPVERRPAAETAEAEALAT
jgi:Na+/H+-dicarboxylate symporter